MKSTLIIHFYLHNKINENALFLQIVNDLIVNYAARYGGLVKIS